jgi:hypothetical protein
VDDMTIIAPAPGFGVMPTLTTSMLCLRFFFGERELGLLRMKKPDREIFMLRSRGVGIKALRGPIYSAASSRATRRPRAANRGLLHPRLFLNYFFSA